MIGNGRVHAAVGMWGAGEGEQEMWPSRCDHTRRLASSHATERRSTTIHSAIMQRTPMYVSVCSSEAARVRSNMMPH